MIKKFRRKPEIIEAIKWTGDNTDEVLDLGKRKLKHLRYKYSPNGRDIVYDEEIVLVTSTRVVSAHIGDYIVKKNNGEICFYKPDIFEREYEEVEEEC